MSEKRADYCDYCPTPSRKDCFACQGTGRMLLCINCEEDTQRIGKRCRECDMEYLLSLPMEPPR